MSGKYIIAILLFFILTICTCDQLTTLSVSEQQAAIISSILDNVTESDFSTRLSLFSNPRQVATSGSEVILVENSIISDLESWYPGQVQTQIITIDKQWIGNKETSGEYTKGPFSMRNIFAIKQGTNPDLAPILIGTHHDTVAYAPGVDDNGSGCAGVLQAADLLQSSNFERSIIFAFFGFEEDGLIGSSYYISNLSSSEYPESAIIMDMIGYTSSVQQTVGGIDVLLSMPRTGNFIGIFGSHNSRALTLDFINSVNRDVKDLPIYAITLDENLGSNPVLRDVLRSDHTPFWTRQIPALFITDTADLRPESPYHTSKDTLSYMNIPFATQVMKAVISTLCVRAGIQ